MPSSFTMVISIALVFSTYPPVSVWGTGGSYLAHEAFLGSIGSLLRPQSDRPIMSQTIRNADLPTFRPTHLARGYPNPRRATFLRPSAACLLQDWVTDSASHDPKTTTNLACLASLASARTIFRRYGNINPLSIDYACRPRLRSRLTQGRLA